MRRQWRGARGWWAAVHALFRYAALRAPEHAALISRVLNIQAKGTATTIVGSCSAPPELLNRQPM
jgi:hypothetical protein